MAALIVPDTGKASRHMGSAVTVVVDTSQLQHMWDQAGDDRRLKMHLQRAVNDTLRWGRARLSDVIRGSLNIKAKDVRDALRVQTFNPKDPTGSLVLTGKRIPLRAFGARQIGGRTVVTVTRRNRKNPGTHKYTLRARGRGVRYRIGAGGGKDVAPNAFMALMPSGRFGAFIRPKAPLKQHHDPKQRHRLPIQQLFGPSLPHFAEKHPELGDKLGTAMTGKLNAELTRQVALYMEGN